MKFSNIRFGFATNSSSSHSVIFMDPEKVKEIQKQDDLSRYSYGWENFTLTSKESKEKYLFATFLNNLDLPMGDAEYLIKKAKYPEAEDKGMYVDHQSLICIPIHRAYDSYGSDYRPIDDKFYTELVDFICNNDNIVILGGNDNDEPHPLLEKYRKNIRKTVVHSLTDIKSNTITSRKTGDWWTIFNKNTGAKYRFTFCDNATPITKSEYPELIDMKITDYCPKNCSFCYQGSTKNGKHADTKKILSFIRNIQAEASGGLYEIAFGGGEPTLHPDFFVILDACKHVGIVPNFTTKDLKWTEDSNKVMKVLDTCGSFGYSVSSLGELKKVHTILESCLKDHKYSYSGKRTQMGKTPLYVIHLIEGTIGNVELKKIFKYCSDNYISMLLLGFKRMGRGASCPTIDQNMWEVLKSSEQSLLKKSRFNFVIDSSRIHPHTNNEGNFRNDEVFRVDHSTAFPISIDTAFAKEHHQELLDSGIDPISFYTEEGKFSMYVDMVDDKMGKSSYHETEDIPYLEEVLSTEDKKVDFDRVIDIYRSY